MDRGGSEVTTGGVLALAAYCSGLNEYWTAVSKWPFPLRAHRVWNRLVRRRSGALVLSFRKKAILAGLLMLAIHRDCLGSWVA